MVGCSIDTVLCVHVRRCVALPILLVDTAELLGGRSSVVPVSIVQLGVAARLDAADFHDAGIEASNRGCEFEVELVACLCSSNSSLGDGGEEASACHW